MIKKPKISIIICAQNEEKNLPWVLNRINNVIKKLRNTEVIVVDGHSTDKTGEIATSFGCKVLQDHRLGKGEALRVGAKNALGDVFIFIDADGSHNPNDIPKLLKPIVKNDVDHVSGSRMLGGSDELYKDIYQFIRLIGSMFITLVANYKLKVRLTDYQNGFRAVKRNVFNRLELTENITTIEQEMVIKTIKKNFSLVEVPTHEYDRRTGQSHIVIWKYAPRYIYSCLKYLFIN